MPLTGSSNKALMWQLYFTRENRITQIQILFAFNVSLFMKVAAIYLKYEHTLTSFLLLCELYFLFKVFQVLILSAFSLVCLAWCWFLMTRAGGAVSPDLIRAVTTADQMKPLTWICFPAHRNTAY